MTDGQDPSRSRTEIVLAFTATPAQEKRLRDLPLLRRLTRGRAATRRVALTYYDTPQWDLQAAGLSLAVETSGHSLRQQAVAADTGWAAALQERVWQNPLPTEDPQVAAIGTPHLSRPLQAHAESLQPAFRLEGRHSERRLDLDDGTEARTVLLSGEVTAAGAHAPLIRFELRAPAESGGALFDLAASLIESQGLRPADESLAARGKRLATGNPPAWVKRSALKLSRKATVEQAMEQMLRTGLDHALANEAAVLHSDHPEGIHQMRVGLRRTRSALRLFKKLLPADDYAWLNGELKWLTDQLGPARDMDVFEDEIVAPVLGFMTDEPAFDGLRKCIVAERRKRRAQARRAVNSDRYVKLILDAGAWLAGRRWNAAWAEGERPAALDGPVTELARKRLAKHHKKVRKDGEQFAELTYEQRHRLRIDLKKLRYALDFFGSLYPKKKVAKYLGRLSGLQDELGYLNDVATARQLVDRLTETCEGDRSRPCRYAGGMVVGWHAKTLADIEGRLTGDIGELLKAQPFWKS